MTTTPEEVKATLAVIRVVADAIRDISAVSPLGGVPSGEASDPRRL